jgi:Zinc carboxypeptidase
MVVRRSNLMLMSLCVVLRVAVAEQPMDEQFAHNVREWTTKAEFLSPLVDHLPKSAAVAMPREVLGQDIGHPLTLHYYSDLVAYYSALAAKSPRVKILDIGKTEEGRDCLVVLVSSEENIRSLETNRQNLAKLADPRTIADAQAIAIISQTRPIYLFMGGLHSNETGPPEMLMELAYRLAVEESPLFDNIRNNVIVAIVPSGDPDGRDRNTDWYYRNKMDDTDDLNWRPTSPFWGKYLLHNDNRDLNYSGASARNLLAYYLKWHPPVMHDLHESIPFLYTYSGEPPQNPDLDPILYGELPWFANFEMSRLTSYGMPGVWTHGFGDAWYPGYLAFMAQNHNGLSRLFETFSTGGGTTMLRHADVPGFNFLSREWFRPLPAYREVQWSLRNNINYMQTAALAALQLTSEFPDIVLQNFYKKTRNSIEDGKTHAPYAYIFPGHQADMTRAAFVINLLCMQGVEVGRATSEFQIKEGTFPAGSLIIKRDQPYGRLAKILLGKQRYAGKDFMTFDDSAWTMGLMAHTEVVESADPKALEIPVERLVHFDPPGQMDDGPAAVYAVLDYGSPNLVTLRYRLRSLNIRIAERSFKAGTHTIPAGSYIVDGTSYDKLKREVERLGLRAIALSAQPPVPMHPAAMPRTAIYSVWASAEMSGWVRYTFDQFDVPHHLIFKEDVRKGRLRSSYDVIIFPGEGSAKSLVYDIEMKGKPLAYTRTPRYKYLGAYGSSEDIRGGMGLEGLIELKKFVEAGGTLITLGDATAVPVEFGISPNVETSSPGPTFYAPGPLVQVKILQPQNPIFYGYSEPETTVRWATNTLLTVKPRDKDKVLMAFTGGEKSVLSGVMRGAEEITERPSIVNMPMGQGQVLMFATNPMYRWQNLGEFRMLFNALLNYKDLH